MPDFLIQLDIRLFYIINHGTANPVFDIIMPFITGAYFYPVYAALIALLIWKGGRKAIICTALLLVTVAISDSLNSRIIKREFERVRPCRGLKDVRLLADCGSGESFPSTHATNNFAAALIVGYFFRRLRWFVFLLAGCISYSRVYIGVHYPFDILGGAAEGMLIAITIIGLWNLAEKNFFSKKLYRI